MTSGGHIKLDLVELIQVADDVNTQVGLQEGASCIVPVTVGRKISEDKEKKGSFVLYFDFNTHTHTRLFGKATHTYSD